MADIQLLPYQEDVSPEYLLSWLYEYMREDGSLPLVFPDLPLSLDGWIRFAGTTGLWVVFEGDEVVGAFWLYETLPGIRSKIGMFCRKKFWRPDFTSMVHDRAIALVFHEIPVEVPLLLAHVWSENRLCARFLLRLGWQKRGTIPGYFGPGKDMMLFYKERQ